MAQESGGSLKYDRINMVSKRTRLIWILLITVWICCFTEATKCYKNDDLGEKEGNVYMCEDESKNECCEEEQEFTCCEPTEKKTLKEQLILWGCVGAAALFIALACLYFWKDLNCLREDTRFSRVCGCCRRKVDEKPLTTMPESRPTTSFNPWQPSFNNSRGQERGESETPPPFYYKTPSYKKY